MRSLDAPITQEDFLKNKGFSAHHFLAHAYHFIQHKPSDIDMQIYRTKIILSYKGTDFVLKCHYRQRSRHFATLLTSQYQELVTFRDSVSPAGVTALLIHVIKSYEPRTRA